MRKPGRRTAFALIGALGLVGSVRPAAAEVLNKKQRAAYASYIAELQGQFEKNPVVDPRDPKLEGRLVQPVDKDFKLLQSMRGKVQVLVAFVVEPDGAVSNARVLGSYGPADLVDVALRSVEQARFEQPGTLDGKAVRVFNFVKVVQQ